MKIINYLSTLVIPFIIFIIIVYGLIERNKVFDTFCCGAKKGVKLVVKIFPTLVGIFLAVELLRTSGVIDMILKILKPIIFFVGIPVEIMPLAILRPISGSAATVVATDIMKTYGVDSNIGLITATIMGATETTLYTIAIYTGSLGIKKTRFVLAAGLIADFIGMVTSVVFCRFLS